MSGLPRLLLAGLVAWGLILAAGVCWYGANPWKALFVLAATSAFAAAWLLLLHSRRRTDRDGRTPKP